MVKRVEDENDRRNKLIYLTVEGNKLKEHLNPWVTEVYGIAAKDISAGDLQQSLALVNQMIRNVKHEL